MQEHTDDQSLNIQKNKRRYWKLCLGLLSFSLLLTVALSTAAALNYLVPKVPGRPQGITARLDWYLHSGQIHADARTLVASFHYITSTERDTPTITELPEQPVAENAAPSAPKS